LIRNVKLKKIKGTFVKTKSIGIVGGPGVAQKNVLRIDFKDKAIDKLYIEKEQIVCRPRACLCLYLKKIKY